MGLNRIILIAMIAAAGSMWLWSSVAHGQADACLVATWQGEVRGIASSAATATKVGRS